MARRDPYRQPSGLVPWIIATVITLAFIFSN